MNSLLVNVYPPYVNFTSLAITTALISDIQVLPNYLVIPIDGTIFNPSVGYQRASITSMPTVNSSSSYEFVLFLNNYVVNTLAKAINTQPYNISTSFAGLPV